MQFSFSRVKKDISYLLNNYRKIYITDSNFASDLPRAKKILRYIIRNNRKKSEFYAELSAEDVNNEIAGLLKKANFTRVGIGLQSDDHTVLRKIGRPFFNRDNFSSGVGILKENGIKVEIEIIFGLPGQTRESFEKTFRFAESLDPFIVKPYCLNLFPNTGVRKEALRNKWLINRRPPYYLVKNEHFTKNEILWFRQFADFIFWFYINKNIKALLSKVDMDYLDFFGEFCLWGRRKRYSLQILMGCGRNTNPREKWYKLKANMQNFLAWLLSNRRINIGKHHYLFINNILYDLKK